MVLEEILCNYIGKKPFDAARRIGANRFMSMEDRESAVERVLDQASKKLEKSLLQTGLCTAAMLSEYLCSLKFHLRENAGLYTQTDEFIRLLSPKNADGTSTYTYNKF